MTSQSDLTFHLQVLLASDETKKNWETISRLRNRCYGNGRGYLNHDASELRNLFSCGLHSRCYAGWLGDDLVSYCATILNGFQFPPNDMRFERRTISLVEFGDVSYQFLTEFQSRTVREWLQQSANVDKDVPVFATRVVSSRIFAKCLDNDFYFRTLRLMGFGAQRDQDCIIKDEKTSCRVGIRVLNSGPPTSFNTKQKVTAEDGPIISFYHRGEVHQLTPR